MLERSEACVACEACDLGVVLRTQAFVLNWTLSINDTNITDNLIHLLWKEGKLDQS